MPERIRSMSSAQAQNKYKRNKLYLIKLVTMETKIKTKTRLINLFVLRLEIKSASVHCISNISLLGYLCYFKLMYIFNFTIINSQLLQREYKFSTKWKMKVKYQYFKFCNSGRDSVSTSSAKQFFLASCILKYNVK